MNHGIGTAIHDFFGEYLGNRFVPGMFFMFLAALTVLWGVAIFCTAIQAPADASGPVMPSLQSIPGELSFVLVLLLFIASYFVGHIFYRQDPKGPDRRSAIRIWKHMTDKDRQKSAVQPSPDGDFNTEYPYLFIHEYLATRGLQHLARWVPWQGSDPTTYATRTKMFINILKTRLQFLLSSDKCQDIKRNEAHIRLMSSVWYAVRLLRYPITLGILLGAAAMAIAWSCGKRVCASEGGMLVVWCGLLWVFIWWVQAAVEKFFHYQRVREIVNVLETANFAWESGYDVFAGLPSGIPPRPQLTPKP